MLTTFKRPSVAQFTDSLQKRQDACNGEGMYCSELGVQLDCHCQVCVELLAAVQGWGRDIMAGRIECDPEVEQLFKAALDHVANRASALVRLAEEEVAVCFSFPTLPALKGVVARITELLRTWTTPQPANLPAWRTQLLPEQITQMRAALAQLPPLVSDWHPNDPRQQRLYKR